MKLAFRHSVVYGGRDDWRARCRKIGRIPSICKEPPHVVMYRSWGDCATGTVLLEAGHFYSLSSPAGVQLNYRWMTAKQFKA